MTLYGIPLVVDRKVPYGRIDPAGARELFIRHALVEGDWQTNHRFFAENRRLLDEAAEVEHRARRRGLVVGEDELFAFYDARIPADVVSAQHFDTWWKRARREDPELLTFKASDLLRDDAADIDGTSYPDIWTSESGSRTRDALPISYAFEPGSQADGVTVDIALSRLNQVNAAEFSWQVPGLRTELVTEMIRSLPKAIRRELVPAPDVAREVTARLGAPAGDLRDAVARELRALRGIDVPRDAWDDSKLPPHLRITVRVTDSGRVLAEGKDVAELQRQLRPRLRAVLSEAAGGITRSGLTSWDFDALPRVFRQDTVVAYPALTDAGGQVDVRLFETEAAARVAMWAGTRRLILRNAPSPVKSVADRLPTRAKLALSHNPHGGVAAMFADCVNCAADYLMAEAGGPAWDREGFERLSATVRSGLHEVTAEVVAQVESALSLAHAVGARLQDTRADAVRPACLGYARAAGPAHLSRFRDWHRLPAAAQSDALPARDRTAAGQAAGEPGPGRGEHGHCPASGEGLRRDGGAPARRAPGRRGRTRGPLDARGTPGQPVRSGPGHLGAGVGEPGAGRAGPPASLRSPARTRTQACR